MSNAPGAAACQTATPALYPLFEVLPSLRAQVPVAGLLPAVTPVTALDGIAGCHVKRDDLSAPDYGGNKIRKLDFLLAAARARQVRDIVAFGYAGSNFVAATAWHARKLGIATHGFLLPQDPAGYVADNLAVALHTGAELRVLPSTTAVAAAAAWRSAGLRLVRGRWPYWIPPGGSSPVGVLGFVNAALELRAQIAAGEVPEPDAIYVAFSSMGTVAGLAIGLALARLRSRIVAVQVVDDRFASPQKLSRLVQQTLALIGAAGKLPAAMEILGRVTIRTEFFGEAYARPTAATTRAIARFEQASGARADSAYTGKALAGLFADLDAGILRGQEVLFWHSFNAHGRPPGVGVPPAAGLAPALRRYFPG